jgi:hypothetical protein
MQCFNYYLMFYSDSIKKSLQQYEKLESRVQSLLRKLAKTTKE